MSKPSSELIIITPNQWSVYDYALVSMTPRLMTSSTSHRGFFQVPLKDLSFGGEQKLDTVSSYNVSESLNASDLTVLEAATVSPAIPDENLSWRISPTSSHARNNLSISSLVWAAETQNRTLEIRNRYKQGKVP